LTEAETLICVLSCFLVVPAAYFDRNTIRARDKS
jgi:hypothetical protein